MKKRDLIIYKVVTALFSAMLLMGAAMYFLQYDMVSETFIRLGVPTEIIYPLAIVKILGIIAIWLIKNNLIKTLAFLGFALDLVFAMIAHFRAEDGGEFGPLVPLILLIISYIYYKKTQVVTEGPK